MEYTLTDGNGFPHIIDGGPGSAVPPHAAAAFLAQRCRDQGLPAGVIRARYTGTAAGGTVAYYTGDGATILPRGYTAATIGTLAAATGDTARPFLYGVAVRPR